MKTKTLSSFILAAIVATPALAAADARAELRPGTTLAVGEQAQLVVTVDDPSARPPSVRVRNADVAFRGQMARTTITNGRHARETSFVYSLVPRAPGPLAIPAITVGGDRTEPLQATVRPAGSARGSASAGRTASLPDEPTRAFVRLDIPKRTIVVGEAVPIQIRAYFRAGTSATLQGPPDIASSAFTISDLSAEPVQKQVELDGVPYLQATWTAVLSPAKPLDGKVTLELPVEIAYREPRPRPARRDLGPFDPFGGSGMDLDALFDDPFFGGSGGDPFAGLDRMFDAGPVKRRSMTLRHAVGPLRIAELPAAGKPADFAGAVGQFVLAVDAPTGEPRVGEPITLTYRVTGTGNFDRVDVDGVSPSADWKAYDTNAGDVDGKGTSGTRIFRQTIVPARAGSIEIPAVSLAYFDPKARAYRTATTQPIALEVAPSQVAGADPDPGLAPAAAIATRARARGPTHATLTPMFRQPGFWLLPAGMLAATWLLAALAWWRRSARARRWRDGYRAHRAIARQRARMDAAAAQADAGAFFDAARAALQLHLARQWGIAPESITAADVDARLGSAGDAIRQIFEHADHHAYAGGTAPPRDLARWRSAVHRQLATQEAQP